MIRLIFDSDYKGGNTAVTDMEDNVLTSVYPNPTTGILQIKSNEANANYQVQVMNMVGQTVLTGQNMTTQIDLSGLNNGIYLLQLTSPQTGKGFMHKVIKTGM